MKHVLAFASLVIAITVTTYGCSRTPLEVEVIQLDSEPTKRLEAKASVVDHGDNDSRSAGNTLAPEAYVVRKEIAREAPASIPEVFLSASHSAMCRVRVGDTMPAMELPQVGKSAVSLQSLMGSQATVILFWRPDRWMSRMALADLEQEVASFAESGKIRVVGIATETPEAHVESEAQLVRASFPQLLDLDGKAFAKVGMVMLPRVFVLNSSGEIVWFDIEYSESTRRELLQTLGVLVGSLESPGGPKKLTSSHE